MLIIGESINTSCLRRGEKAVEQAVITRDVEMIAELAWKQFTAGAGYIDINAGTLTSGEPEALAWLTKVVQQAVPAPICFDSPNPRALAAALQVYQRKNGRPMINSISAECARFDGIFPLVRAHQAKVIALAIDDTGIQADLTCRFMAARVLLDRLLSAGVPMDDIYLDPLTFPLGATDKAALSLLTLIDRIHAEFPGIHTIVGFSNISHGLPSRKVLNQALVVLALGHGVDAGIIDATDSQLMDLIAATEALLGRDPACRGFLARTRATP
jgi:5-methyltetrahydrofolate--homocysteine methyltransferase